MLICHEFVIVIFIYKIEHDSKFSRLNSTLKPFFPIKLVQVGHSYELGNRLVSIHVFPSKSLRWELNSLPYPWFPQLEIGLKRML